VWQGVTYSDIRQEMLTPQVNVDRPLYLTVFCFRSEIAEFYFRKTYVVINVVICHVVVWKLLVCVAVLCVMSAVVVVVW